MSGRERQIPYDFTYIWNLKKKKKNKQKQTHRSENKLMVARGEEGRRWVKNMKGNKRVRLPVKK